MAFWNVLISIMLSLFMEMFRSRKLTAVLGFETTHLRVPKLFKVDLKFDQVVSLS
jgi:hypothetical protein